MSSATRRDFLGALGAVGACACNIPKEAMTSKQVAKETLVGAHPWVYAATRPDYDIYGVIDEIIADMAYAGMDFIELMHTALEPDEAVERIGALSEQHKLPVIGTSYSANMWNQDEQDEIFEYADRMIGRLQRLRATTIGVSVGHPTGNRKKTENELDTQADLLRRIMYRASVNGIVVNLHNHTYEVENDEHDLRGTLARIPDARLGPDLDWLVGAGEDPVEFIKRYGDRIVYAHLRDRSSDGLWVEAMGEGTIDYAAVAAALREVNFSGDLAIELAHPENLQLTRPLRESLKISREYVRKTMGY